MSEWFVGTERRSRTTTVGTEKRPKSVEMRSFAGGNGSGKLESRSVFTYDAEGRKRVEVVERRWLGVMKKARTEYDADGNRLSVLETSSDHQCRRRRGLTRYAKDGRLLDSKETCDDKHVESVKATFDKADRALTLERIYDVGDGSRPKRREEVETWTYDACGAMKTHTVDHKKGSPTVRHVAWSPRGKLKSITIDGRVVRSRTYDKRGNLVEADGTRRYIYDARGRLTSIADSSPSGSWPARIVIAYECP